MNLNMLQAKIIASFSKAYFVEYWEIILKVTVTLQEVYYKFSI